MSVQLTAHIYRGAQALCARIGHLCPKLGRLCEHMPSVPVSSALCGHPHAAMALKAGNCYPAWPVQAASQYQVPKLGKTWWTEWVYTHCSSDLLPEVFR